MIGLTIVSAMGKMDRPEKSGPSYRPYPNEAKVFDGYGADKEDIQRGYLDCSIKERPEYDKVNYNERWTQPRMPDEDAAYTEETVDNFEFIRKSERTKGLFTRPRTPTER